MEKFIIDNIWSLIVAILLITFNIGYTFRSLKSKTSNDDVHKIVGDKIKSHKSDCSFFDKTDGKVLNQCVRDIEKAINKIESKVDKIYDKLLEN